MRLDSGSVTTHEGISPGVETERQRLIEMRDGRRYGGTARSPLMILQKMQLSAGSVGLDLTEEEAHVRC